MVNEDAKRQSFSLLQAISLLMLVLLVSSGYSVFVKPPGPTSFPLHVASFVLSAGYFIAIYGWRRLRPARADAIRILPILLPSERRPRWRSLVLFLVFVVVFAANNNYGTEGGSTIATYQAWSLAITGTADLRQYDGLRPIAGDRLTEAPDGAVHADLPPGAAIAALPVVLPLALFLGEPPKLSRMQKLGKAVATVYVALALVLFYWTCHAVAPGATIRATLLLAFGTTLWSGASQGLWPAAPAVFWLCVALWLSMRTPLDRPSLRAVSSGAALGLAVLTVPATLVFFAGALAAAILSRRWRWSLMCVAGAFVPLAACVLYFVGGDGAASTAAKAAAPYGLALGSLLVSPANGLLVFTPALILVPLGLASMASAPRAGTAVSIRLTLICWSAAALAFLLVSAGLPGACLDSDYGPRILTAAFPVLCLLFALADERLGGTRWHLLATLLIGLSILIQIPGAIGRRSLQPFDDGNICTAETAFSLRGTPIEQRFRAFFDR